MGKSSKIDDVVLFFDNYGVDHRFLLKTTEKVETHQCMKTEDGTEYKLDTMYYRFRDVQDAGREYLSVCADEEDMDEYWKEEGVEFPERQHISVKSEKLPDLHVCKEEWVEGMAYHIVCTGQKIRSWNWIFIIVMAK